VTHALRAALLLAAGVALRDCLLLATGTLVFGIHQQQRLAACPDREHAWLRCVIDGSALLAVGALLAAHTAAVSLGWWPSWTPLHAVAAATLALVVAVGGLAAQQLTWRHGLIAAATVAVVVARQPWAACAFAATAAAFTLSEAVRHLGPLARTLALPHDQR
jgi:sugar phosphate permease